MKLMSNYLNNINFRKIIGVSLKNEIGEQNCFLNVIMHALYHMKEIRNYFINEEIKNDVKLNLFSELKVKYII